MTMFTRRCSRQLIKWRSEFASGFKIFLTLLLLSSFFTPTKSDGQCNSFGVDFKQAANDDNFKVNNVPYAMPGEIHWINSILQNSNSRYVEGMSTLQRIIFNNLADCNGQHILRIQMECRKSTQHAYDFITSWDNALLAAAAIAPGLGLMPTNRSDPKLHECGPDIGACSQTACNLVTGGGSFRDLPVIFSAPTNPTGPGESNLAIVGPPADQNTTRQVIGTYECRYGPRTVRVYVDNNSFTGTNGDANNQVVFAGYGDGQPGDGGDTYIFYDVKWQSSSPDVVIEYAAHIGVGVDGLAAANPGGCNINSLGVGYLINHGASAINGGPYHTILDEFVDPTTGAASTCEGNLGNQDNQLQGSQILLIPLCNITQTGGGPSPVCVGSGNLTFNAHPLNLEFDNQGNLTSTFQWTITHNETGASIVGSSTDSIVVVAPGNTPGCDSLRFIVNNPTGPFSDTCVVKFCVTCSTPTIGTPGPNATIECTATPSFTAPTGSDACGAFTVNNLGTTTSTSGCTKVLTTRWDVTNACGNHSATASQVITIVDTQPPTIGQAGGNATIECTATPSFSPPTASDACNGATVNNLGTTTSTTGCTKVLTRTWDATDACGNHSATRTQVITVVDTQPPTIGDAGANATIQCTGTPSFTPPTASDACNGATVNNLGTTTTTTGGATCTVILTRTWDATDACGNHSATRTQVITVVDTTPPTIGSAGGNATIECTATPSFTAPTASDLCSGATVNNLGTTTSTTGCTTVLTRTWDATDACGNHSATRTQVITVVDTTPPTIGSAGGNATIECTASPSFTAPTASDACNGATVNNLGTTTSTTGCTSVITRTWDATDACGNHSATRTQVITVVDTTPPTIGSAGGNATIECTATPSFTAPTASDACNGATVNNLGTTTSTTGCTSVITRRWDATDACGNHSVTRTQVITVVDTTPPTIGDAGANATIQCTGTPNFTAPTASDACNGATVNNLGTTTSTSGGATCTTILTRTWDATDACGNHSATRTQVITVVDTTPPTIGNAGGNATIECTATPNFTAPTASDLCSGATVNNLGTTTSTTGCTSVITRTWDATDACGNHSATRTQVITVVDTTPPTIGDAGGNATIECTATPSFTAPTASDACNGATVNNLGTTTTTTGCTSVITRRWDATDACGNHSVTRTQVITVVDTTPPTIGQAGGNATIECTATPSFTAPTASDACNGATVNNLGTTTSTTGCTSVITRTWDATDACGNHSATRTQVITVVDTTPPTIGQAGGNATIECTATPSFTAPTASDACNGATVNNLGTTTSTTGCTSVITRRWDATDACGNHSATRTQVITVVDTTPPTIGGQGANAELSCNATPNFTPPTASDACNGATVNQLTTGTTTTATSTTITRTWDATDACGNHSATVSQTIIIDACPTTFCGFTQGFYGNKNGLAAMRDSGLLLSPIIIGSTLPGKNSVLIPAGDPSAVKVNQVMPGQSTPGPLTVSGQCNILDPCFNSYLNNKGKISNVLLGQTIALSLNVRLHNTLLGLPAIPAGQCFIIEGDTLNINQNVVNYLICTSGSATVAKILQLANDLLGGVLVPGQQVSGCTVPSYGDITEAVDFLNTSFDECKNFTGFGSCVPLAVTSRAIVPQETVGGLKVTAYPNPFSSVVKFTLHSNVSGEAQLEVYNQLGQKVSTIYRGYLQANRNQVVEYKAPRLGGNQLIYILRVGGHSVTGKLLRLE